MKRYYGRVPVEPGEGVECRVCGAYLRTLAGHVVVHGLSTTDYRVRFPGAPLVGTLLRGIRRDYYDDGNTGLPGKRRATCRRGHRLTASNTYVRPNGNRACRKCTRARNRRAAAASRERRREARRLAQRTYYARNREAIIAKQRDREGRREYQAKWAREARARRKAAA